MEMARTDRGGADDQGAIGDCVGDALEFFGAGENGGGAHGGTRLLKRGRVGIDDAEMMEAEIAHGARGGADVERVARGDEDDAQAVGFGGSKQAAIF